jgi:hypothetical protein
VREFPIEKPPRRAVPTSIASIARLLTDHSRLTIPQSVVGSMWTAAKDRLTKPFDSTKKPWKKPGSGNSDQISHLTEETAKLKKRLKQKSKKHKKRARDLSKTDSDSS